jgi:hypothetical protein
MARKGRVGVLLRTRLTTFAGRGNRCCGTSDFVAPRPSLQLIQQRRQHVFTQVTLKLFHRPEVLLARRTSGLHDLVFREDLMSSKIWNRIESRRHRDTGATTTTVTDARHYEILDQIARNGRVGLVWRASLFIVLFFIMSPLWLRAQEATTNHNVILRRDPSTSSPALEHLSKGTRVTLVDEAPDNGFYHVRTEDDRVGWVFGKYVSISTAETPATPTAPSTPPSTECDPSISTHVYHPNRLIVKQDCIAVTGTIVDATAAQSKHQADGTRHEKDGDTHGWLKVDSGFENLLNSGNMDDEDGNLVFEIICRFPVTQTDAKAACQGYTDRISLPPVGSHVRIVGRFVQDTFHGQWNEIHPVISITVAP